MRIRNVLRYFTFKEQVILGIGLFLKKIIKILPNYNYLENESKMLKQYCGIGYKIKSEKKNIVINKDHRNVKLRRLNSDFNVFNQVILEEEYRPVVDILKSLNIQIDTIIDAGANIGLTTLYFHQFFPSAQIVSIEPENDNFNNLLYNIANIDSIHPINCGLWFRNEKLIIDNTFRDKKSWSLITKPSENQTGIEGVTLDWIVNHFNLKRINLLKIDIEGAERFIFESYEKIDKILQFTDVIALEIHDEVANRETIYQSLTNNGFSIVEKGELSIGYKRNG